MSGQALHHLCSRCLLKPYKRLYHHQARFFMKLAAIKFFTRISAMVEPEPPLRVGLKEGIDIGTLVDLDSMLNFDDDQDDVKDFLTLVLLRHLGLSMPSFGRFSPERLYSILSNEFFESEEVYLEAVRASEGNPRDFFKLLSLCAANVGVEGDRRVSRRNVIAAANQLTEDKEALSESLAAELF